MMIKVSERLRELQIDTFDEQTSLFLPRREPLFSQVSISNFNGSHRVAKDAFEKIFLTMGWSL